MKKKRVLFLCTGNSIRSQMAEGYLRSMADSKYEVFSAGVSPAGIHALTIEVMAEDGVDIRGQHSKSVEDIDLDSMDHVITLCSHAQKVCPSFSVSVPREHWPIDDPLHSLMQQGDVTDRFRVVRDNLRKRIQDWIKREPT